MRKNIKIKDKIINIQISQKVLMNMYKKIMISIIVIYILIKMIVQMLKNMSLKRKNLLIITMTKNITIKIICKKF